jgi:hypothetical protein
MKVTLTASTDAKVVVWREGDLFNARRAESADRPQVCLAVDLFEVIAELAGLDLEQAAQVAEAMELAGTAQSRLAPLETRPIIGNGHEAPSSARRAQPDP